MYIWDLNDSVNIDVEHATCTFWWKKNQQKRNDKILDLINLMGRLFLHGQMLI